MSNIRTLVTQTAYVNSPRWNSKMPRTPLVRRRALIDMRCLPALAQAFLFWQKARGVQEPLTLPGPAAEHGGIIQKKKYKRNANGLCFKGHVEKREHFQTQVTEMIILKWET